MSYQIRSDLDKVDLLGGIKNDISRCNESLMTNLIFLKKIQGLKLKFILKFI